jgi:hypothetical protein
LFSPHFSVRDKLEEKKTANLIEAELFGTKNTGCGGGFACAL